MSNNELIQKTASLVEKALTRTNRTESLPNFFVQTNKMHFVDLNDDALLKIVEYLDLEDKIRLWKTTEPTTRLADITSIAWRRQTMHFIDLNVFTSLELLNSFLSIICPTVLVVVLQMREVREPQMNIVRRHVFPKARHLEVNILLDWSFDVEIGGNCFDRGIGMLADSFPNIKIIHLFGTNFSTTGLHFSKWQCLTELNVVKASEWWTTENFKEICEKSKNLEALSINIANEDNPSKENPYIDAICTLENLEHLWFNAMFISKDNSLKLLTKLPKLRRLRCNESDQHWAPLMRVRDTRAEDVRSIASSDLWMCYSSDDDSETEAAEIFRVQFRQVLRNFPRLEALHLRHSNIWRTGDQLWDMLYHCPHLKMLSIRTVDMRFFKFRNATMNRALRLRTEPLNFHVQDTEHQTIITTMLSCPDIKVTFGPLPEQLHVFENYCVEFNFHPMVSKI